MTTLPGSSPTSSPSSGSNPHHSGKPSGTGTSVGSNPTTDPSNTNDPSGASNDDHHTTAIALGTVFGVVCLLVGSTTATWYFRRRSRARQSFQLISPPASDGGDDDSMHIGSVIPIAGSAYRNQPGAKSMKDRLTGFVPGMTSANHPLQPERRDMLADEDTREFGHEFGIGLRRGTSSSQSSWREVMMRPATLGDRVYGSLSSLRNVGGVMLDYASGGRARREASGGSRSTAWRSEKEASDPFADNPGYIKAVPYASSRTASRPRGGRQGSSYTYTDPFEDYEVEALPWDGIDKERYRDDVEDVEKGYPSLADPPPRPHLQSLLPAATLDLTRLTPVSEQPSLSTLTESVGTPSDSSHSNSSPFTNSSHEQSRSPRRPSSILDANPPSLPIRRSNSWWARFSETPLLGRRASDAGSRKSQHLLDFRDPNPPPSRLVAIEESTSGSFDTPAGRRSSSGGGHAQLYSAHTHARSASSLQTSRTADSEMIERMGRTMDIVQKESTMNSHLSGASEEENATTGPSARRALSIVTSSGSNNTSDDDPLLLVQSPEALSENEATVKGRANSRSRSPPGRLTPPQRAQSPPSRGGTVAARIQAFERRMSKSEEGSPLRSPPPVRPRQHPSVYGVVPKPSLFVANPDDRRGSSSDS